MADTVENAAFWLPTHFFADDDLLTDDDLLSLNTNPTIRRHRPDPFSSPPDPFSFLHPPLSSTETHRDIHPTKTHNNDDDDDDEEELLAELTRYLTRSSLNHSQKGWGYSTSPQSTLAGFGSWSSNRSGFSTNGSPTGPSRIPSPPLTPYYQNDPAHVTLLKLNASTVSLPRHHLSSLYSHPQVRRQGSEERADCHCSHQNIHHQQHHRSYGGGSSGWAPQRARQMYTQKRTEEMTTVFLGGSGPGGGGGGVKKQLSGTGVFIPRISDSGTHLGPPEINAATTTRKVSGCSTVLLPARVVQALNLDIDKMKNGGGANYSNTPKRVLTHHEIMVARRNALMNMQRRNGRVGGGAAATATMVGHHVMGLPTDWTY